MKKIIYISFLSLAMVSVASIVIGQTSTKKKDYLIGEAERKTILPTTLTYSYKSGFDDARQFQIRYDFKKKSFFIIDGDRKLGPTDNTLNQFEVSHYPFVYEEFLLHVGTDTSKKCYSFTFYIDNDPLVKEGQYQLCDDESEVILLKGLIDEEFMELVYDSSITDKIMPDGIWEEVTDK